ncbi:MAG: hypothetical protein OXJ52_05335 [Oligoflexia bacterium]|nr:hypothetical protein [Oligoflexia bacterium]
MKIFIILSFLLSTQAYSKPSETELIAFEEQRKGAIVAQSDQCRGHILGFNKALKLTLGKSLSNSNRFKTWKETEIKKLFALSQLSANAYKASNIKAAYAKAIDKAKELASVNCKYWIYLETASLKEIQSQIK